MKAKTFIISGVALAAAGATAQSCLALATSTVGVAVIKQILLGGITKGLNTFKDKNAFLQSNLIDQAMPQQLRNLNNMLEKVAPSLVTKQREYIAEAAAYTVNTAQPILVNAVNGLTSDDITRIASGGKGAATKVLKEKTQEQLIQAIMPKVDEKLNQFGIVKTVNTALSGNSILNSLLGNQNSSSNGSALSRLASEQMVDGLFNIVENYEDQNTAKINQALGK